MIFTADSRTAHNFSWGGRQLFDNAAIEHHEGVWRFHTHSTRWQVHGHWVGSSEVHGSICALDSQGHCSSEHPAALHGPSEDGQVAIRRDCLR